MGNSIQLAKFHLALHEIRERIDNEIIPVGIHLECADVEMLQTLALATSAIEQYLKSYRLEAVPVTKV